MIPELFVQEWKAHAPWPTDAMVEQDLIICRSLVAIFSHPVLSRQLTFRGGTALHKLHLAPPSRYSEDIDLVQAEAGPIGPVFDALKECLDGFLGKPKRKQGPGVVTLGYRVPATDPSSPGLKLKVEINSREHFRVLEPTTKPLAVDSRWFSGSCEIPTFEIEELLGTKLRALYQRRKGRDLFDLWLGLTQGRAQPSQIAECFQRYMSFGGLRVSGPEFRINMEGKLSHPDFVHDMDGLLRPGTEFDLRAAYELVDREILSAL